MPTNNRRCIIEEQMPLTAVSARRAREKSIRHGHLSTLAPPSAAPELGLLLSLAPHVTLCLQHPAPDLVESLIRIIMPIVRRIPAPEGAPATTPPRAAAKPISANHVEIEKRLWDAADQLRANSKLKASEYSIPVLGLIFLRYADSRFEQVDQRLLSAQSNGRRPLSLSKARYQAEGVLYIPEAARFAHLLWLPEGADIGRAINDAMRAIEAENEDLRDVLPKTYNRLENTLLVALLKNLSSIPTMDGDAFGKIYEYFLGKFAMSEGQKGGEFFTPISIVRLIVEIIEPFHGRIFDPACGSGGMFVQSADFVKSHQQEPGQEISVYGQEKTSETVRLARMNLAVHGLSGDIKQGNTYYEDMHNLAGKFDFVMANPPFNVDKVDKERIKDDRGRFPLGMPTER